MSDRLSALLQRFELRARVLHGGALCGVAHFDASPGRGHLHLLRQGRLGVTGAGGRRTVIDEPSVLFFPRPTAHWLDGDEQPCAELVCATVEFGLGEENPLLQALPPLLVVPLARLPALGLVQQLLFAEASGQRCGHDAAVNRLVEVLMIQLLRHTIEQRIVPDGLMAGLADARLHKALSAVHAEPGRDWTLASMAAEAGLSRARFAALFAQLIGVPPGEYVTRWRLGLARTLLRRGLPLKQVAVEVGYANASALGRIFSQRLGCSPAAWQRADSASRVVVVA